MNNVNLTVLYSDTSMSICLRGVYGSFIADSIVLPRISLRVGVYTMYSSYSVGRIQVML